MERFVVFENLFSPQNSSIKNILFLGIARRPRSSVLDPYWLCWPQQGRSLFGASPESQPHGGCEGGHWEYRKEAGVIFHSVWRCKFHKECKILRLSTLPSQSQVWHCLSVCALLARCLAMLNVLVVDPVCWICCSCLWLAVCWFLLWAYVPLDQVSSLVFCTPSRIFPYSFDTFYCKCFLWKTSWWLISVVEEFFLLEIPNYSLCFVLKKSTPDFGLCLSLSHSHFDHVAMDN